MKKATLSLIEAAARAQGLILVGVVPDGAAPMPEGVRSVALLAPDEPAFWPRFTQSAEYRDGLPDPMDRWSQRVIGAIASGLDAQALFPFGTSAAHPFYAWALASGLAWPSPVQFLVSERAGLWASYRGALGLPIALEAPVPVAARLCDNCPQPCTTACPVAALTEHGYDLKACHAYLDTPEGRDCLDRGCAVRAACPVSQRFGRDPAQSAFHMQYFHRISVSGR